MCLLKVFFLVIAKLPGSPFSEKIVAKDNMNNYLPISILTCFYKTMKKILYLRLYKFLKNHAVYSTKINMDFVSK